MSDLIKFFSHAPHWFNIADAFPDKALVLCPYEGWVHDIDIKIIENKLKKTGKIPVIPTPDRAAKTLGTAAAYYEFLQNA